MKTLTLFSLLCLSAFWGYPRESVPFVNPGALWYVAHAYINASPEYPAFVETTTRVMGFRGDTLLDGETWYKFYATPDSFFSSDYTYKGSVKEENGVVVFRNAENSTDTLYNFNLLPGDSVFYPIEYCFSNYMKVESVDSVELAGRYHKRINFEEILCPPFTLSDTWIEGIGSVKGPLFPLYPLEEGSESPDSVRLTCYSVEEVEVWQNPHYEQCYIHDPLPTSISYMHDEDIVLYPNPVYDKLVVGIPGRYAEAFTVSVFDLTGGEIFSRDYKSSLSAVVDTSLLPTGIYIVRISTGGKAITRKLVKH